MIKFQKSRKQQKPHILALKLDFTFFEKRNGKKRESGNNTVYQGKI